MKLLAALFFTAPLTLATSPALAAPYDDVFFVKAGGDGRQMLADRTACTVVAKSVGIGHGEAYSDPDYGVISAMGSALDSDSMHGGVSRKVQRAVLEKCMEKHGWTQQDPLGDDVKTVKKASESHPEALDAWIKANQPKPEEKKAAATPAPKITTAAAPSTTPPAAATPPTAPPATTPSTPPASATTAPLPSPPSTQAAPPPAPTQQPHT